MTQSEFAAEFEVDPTTVSRWEKGKLNPSAAVWKRVREIALYAAGPLSDQVISASPLMKRVARMENLKRSCVVSKGFLEEFHIKPGEIADTEKMSLVPPSDPQYQVSTSRFYDIIQANPYWLKGGIVYAEAHAFAVGVDFWVEIMVAQLPDQDAALIEAVESRKGEQGGFWVRFCYVEGLKGPEGIGEAA